MAQLIKCLPCKYEELNSIPRTHVKMQGMVKHTGEICKSLMIQSRLIDKLRANEGPYLKLI